MALGGRSDRHRDYRLVGIIVVSALVACGEPKGMPAATGPATDVTAYVESRSGTVLAPSVPLVNVVGGQIVGDSVLVTDRGAGRIYMLDANGHVLRTFGGFGDGPGEFRDLRWSRLLGSTLFAYDREHNRVTRIQIDGDDVTIEPVTPPAEGLVATVVLGVLKGESLVIGAQEATAQPKFSGVVHAPTELFVKKYLSGDSAVARTGSVRGSDVYFHVWPDGWRTQLVAAMGRRSYIAVGQRAVIAIDNGGPQVFRVKLDGKVDTFHVALSPRASVTRRDIESVRSRYLPTGSSDSRMRTAFDAMPIPDSAPLFAWRGEREVVPLVAASNGDIWILPYSPDAPEPAWLVLDEDGEPIWTVRFDRESVLFDATRSEVLLATENDEGAVVLARRPIVRRTAQ